MECALLRMPLLLLTVWQMPEYLISTSTSSGRSSSMMIGVSLNSSPGVSTTRASVSRGNCMLVGRGARQRDDGRWCYELWTSTTVNGEKLSKSADICLVWAPGWAKTPFDQPRQFSRYPTVVLENHAMMPSGTFHVADSELHHAETSNGPVRHHVFHPCLGCLHRIISSQIGAALMTCLRTLSAGLTDCPDQIPGIYSWLKRFVRLPD